MFETPSLDLLTDFNWLMVLPGITLVFGTMALLLFDVLIPEERKHLTPKLALVGIVVSFVLTLFTYNPENTTTFAGMFTADPFHRVFESDSAGDSLHQHFAKYGLHAAHRGEQR